MKHKHYDCIVAWANGAVIEVFNAEMEEWETIADPHWFADNVYRIRPVGIGMNREVMIKALNVIKESVINIDFPLTNKLADAIYAIEVELSQPVNENAVAVKVISQHTDTQLNSGTVA